MNCLEIKNAAPSVSEAVKNKNGRTAYNSLFKYYEGEDFIQRNIQIAFDKLNITFYKGENTNFIFEKYVSFHLEAHRLLLERKYRKKVELTTRPRSNNFKVLSRSTPTQNHLNQFLKLKKKKHHVKNSYLSNKNANSYCRY